MTTADDTLPLLGSLCQAARASGPACVAALRRNSFPVNDGALMGSSVDEDASVVPAGTPAAVSPMVGRSPPE